MNRAIELAELRHDIQRMPLRRSVVERRNRLRHGVSQQGPGGENGYATSSNPARNSFSGGVMRIVPPCPWMDTLVATWLTAVACSGFKCALSRRISWSRPDGGLK